ncbi:hypothetical protein PIB30_013142 [Stylosanthes scabra]|uniref:GRF-type domain-containing protein n=1 Tax=Stylosanthes scabra TaxID=79078 RepID=A0ABU6X6D9_9FABA|nr:hypothetical protein [Stylosanthes scabra]
MATHSSTPRGSDASSLRSPLVCSHGRSPMLHISKTKDNPARRFWGCVFYVVQDKCEFFQWANRANDLLVAEFGKLKKRLDILKSRVVSAQSRFTAAMVFAMVG